jgi:hypothetical protein
VAVDPVGNRFNQSAAESSRNRQAHLYLVDGWSSIARYHLVDNTRGQPPVWDKADVRELALTIENGKLAGKIHLEHGKQSRGFMAELTGEVQFMDGVQSQFDVLAKGEYWGTGEFTLEPPPGKFPLIVAFRLADRQDVADLIPPHGAGGWLDGYLDPSR